MTNAGALVDYGWDERVLALFNAVADPSLEPARVVRVERSACIAVFSDGAERVIQAGTLPAVGDWLGVQGSMAHVVLTRWSALSRADASGRGTQVLAANVDLVVITAPADRLSPARVERELALAWDSGARPLVVLTKGDLAPPGLEASLRERLVAVDVLVTSATTHLGIDELAHRLRPNHTAVLLGPSGAGKSSLGNALLGRERLATGLVREGDARGRHTTTSRQLVAVPGGGVLIDTPGLRSLGLGADTDLDTAYPDIDSLAQRCRFRDCRHEAEPGCAVSQAAGSGALDPARLASFLKLQGELVAEARRVDPQLRKEAVAMWKARTKAARAHDKRKPH
jgi:ribosome biogenesis GTPase / thiamine phosphate phosphatase